MAAVEWTWNDIQQNRMEDSMYVFYVECLFGKQQIKKGLFVRIRSYVETFTSVTSPSNRSRKKNLQRQNVQPKSMTFWGRQAEKIP